MSKSDSYYSISNKLKNEKKITEAFEVMFHSLTLEELIALSNELAQGILNDLISQGEDKVLEKKEELIDIIKEYKIPYSYKIVDPTIVLQNMTAYTPPVPPDGEDG